MKAAHLQIPIKQQCKTIRQVPACTGGSVKEEGGVSVFPCCLNTFRAYIYCISILCLRSSFTQTPLGWRRISGSHLSPAPFSSRSEPPGARVTEQVQKVAATGAAGGRVRLSGEANKDIASCWCCSIVIHTQACTVKSVSQVRPSNSGKGPAVLSK